MSDSKAIFSYLVGDACVSVRSGSPEDWHNTNGGVDGAVSTRLNVVFVALFSRGHKLLTPLLPPFS